MKPTAPAAATSRSPRDGYTSSSFDWGGTRPELIQFAANELNPAATISLVNCRVGAPVRG
jgi:hypothetical protein